MLFVVLVAGWVGQIHIAVEETCGHATQETLTSSVHLTVPIWEICCVWYCGESPHKLMYGKQCFQSCITAIAIISAFAPKPWVWIDLAAIAVACGAL